MSSLYVSVFLCQYCRNLNSSEFLFLHFIMRWLCRIHCDHCKILEIKPQPLALVTTNINICKSELHMGIVFPKLSLYVTVKFYRSLIYHKPLPQHKKICFISIKYSMWVKKKEKMNIQEPDVEVKKYIDLL